MYKYVEDKAFLKRAQTSCSTLIKELEDELREKWKINSQMFLVGSGGRNMVTQNENGDIDFDYNLNIISCPSWSDAKGIKESVRKAFNKVMANHKLNDVDDSTSSLTTDKLHFGNDTSIQFSIDVAIVTKDNNGQWERLIHQKTGFISSDSWIWNIAPNSQKVKEKADVLKKNNLWEEVRDVYLEKKNFYLRRNDNNHSSFICYIEAVNQVYSKYYR